VQRWAEALAQGDYDGAARLLNRDGNEGDWPPALVREAIESYAPGPSPPLTAYRDVTRWAESPSRPEVVGSVHYDLTIDGVLSDLTAIFWLRRVAGGLELELHDIHVL
jgi:hypothetical protein